MATDNDSDPEDGTRHSGIKGQDYKPSYGKEQPRFPGCEPRRSTDFVIEPTTGRLTLTVGGEAAVGTTGPFDVSLPLKFLKQALCRLQNLLPVNLSDLRVKLSFFNKLLV